MRVAREISLKGAIAAMAVLAVGCALDYAPVIPVVPTGSAIPVAAAVLPDPRGTVVVEDVICTRPDLPADTAALLSEALLKSVALHGLAPRDGDSSGVRYTFTVRVGGVGAGLNGRSPSASNQLSYLEVRGALRRFSTGIPACDIFHRRSIFRESSEKESFRNLISDVAEDIVEELKVRLHGGGHIVSLPSVLDPDENALSEHIPLKIRFYPLQDGRRDKKRLGYIRPDARLPREALLPDRQQVSRYLLETLREGVCTSGHQAAEEGEDVTVSGVLRLFWLWTEQTSDSRWDVFAEVEFVLELVNRTSGRSVSIPLVVLKKDTINGAPSPAVFEKVAGEAVAETVNQVKRYLSPSFLPR